MKQSTLRRPHRRSRGSLYQLLARAAAALLLAALALAWPSLRAELLLSEPSSPVYYGYALAGGDEIEVDKNTEIIGNVHANDEVELEKGTRVEGDVSAVDEIENEGTITGTVTEGAEPLALPEIDQAALLAAADRVLSGNVTFTDEVIDDVVYVDGDVKIKKSINGVGTLFATGKIKVEKAKSGTQLADGTRLSLIALEKIEIKKNRHLRGVLRSGDEIKLDRNNVFEGVLVADGEIEIKKNSRITFLSADQETPTIELISPPEGSVVDTPTPTIEVAYADAFSGLDLASLVVLLDGADSSGQASANADGFTLVPQPLADGPHGLEVRIRDLAGNEASASFSFTVLTDGEAPALAITAPALPLAPLGAPVAVEVQYSDDSGIDLGSLSIALDGVDLTGACTVGAASASCTATGLGEGEHTITASIADAAGNVAGASLTFEVTAEEDTVGPDLFIISPTNSTLPAGQAFSLTVKYADEGVGAFPPSLRILLDGTEVTGSCETGPTQALCPVAGLAAGTHLVEASITDRLGNGSSTSRAYEAEAIADDEPPLLEIVSPTGQPFVAGQTVGITVGYSDALAGIDLGSLSITLDGVDLTAGCAIHSILSFCEGPALTIGSHTLEAEVRDLVGNAATASLTFLAEDAADLPQIEIVSPAGPSTTDPAPPILVRYSATARPIEPASFVLLADGVPPSLGCTAGPAEATCTSPVFTPGPHTLEARISDVGGLEARATLALEVQLDEEAPVVTLSTPVDGSGSTEPELTVSGTATDDFGVVRLVVNGEETPLAPDGSFETTVTLEQGFNFINVEASDESGRIGAASANVRFPADETAPRLEITSLQEGGFVTAARPPIELRYLDESDLDLEGLELLADGLGLVADCELGPVTGFCDVVEDLPEGPITLEARLADVFGNQASASVSVTVDTAGVGIAIDSPAEGLVTAAASVEVTGSVDPPDAPVEVNGVAASVAGGAFTATVPLREGRNMLVAVANKANGNTGTASVDVARDIQPPIVRIATPRDGLVATAERVGIAGLVNDIVDGGRDAEVRVNGQPAAVSAGTFMIPDLLLVPGPNVIEAVATDAAGNEGRHRITVDFQPPAGARIRVASGSGQAAVVNGQLAEPLVALVTDPFGNPLASRLVRFRVSRNNGLLRRAVGEEPVRSLEIPTDGAGRASVLLTLGDTSGEGNHRVLATGLGVAGEAEFCASALPDVPVRVLMVNGDNQRGAVGRPLPTPLEAILLDANGNPLPGIPITFTVVEGGGHLDGAATALRLTDDDGIARAVLTLGATPGINSNAVSATVEGADTLPATFVATALVPGPPAATSLAGVVLDNTQSPIPNTLVTIEGTALSARTDDVGAFSIPGVPVGHLLVHFDPSESPRAETFPPLEMETVTVAGQRNTLGQPVELPAIDSASSQIVGGSEDVTLVMEGVEGMTLTIAAGSATFPDGSPTGRLSISQVHLDKVPMPPPNGSLFMPPAWTIQPAGVRFDPPARISIPNDGLPPGRVIDIFQFDHPTGTFINVGKGVVSDDGFSIDSDGGFGIVRSGWGGCGLPPPPPTCTDACPECQKCSEGSGRCVDDDSQTPSFPPPFSEQASAKKQLVSESLKRAIRGIPFVGSFEASVGGAVQAMVSPICCNGSPLTSGKQVYSGSVNAQLALKLQLTPLPNLNFRESFTLFGVRVGIELVLNLGPYIQFTASPVASVSGEKNLCEGTDCLKWNVCSVFGIQAGAEAELDFELEIGDDIDIIDDDDDLNLEDDELLANVNVFGEGTGAVGVDGDTCTGVNESTACIKPITGNVELMVNSFVNFQFSVELYSGGGDCCG